MRLASLAGCSFLLCASTASAGGAAASTEDLLRDLSAETAEVRDRATHRLEKAAGLSEEDVRAALCTADSRAKPHLLRLVAARGMTGLVPDAAASLASDDLAVRDAAVRALVGLGDDAVAAGLAALRETKGADADAARTRLRALAARRTVEREVVSRWRRKGGSYEGRYRDLAKLGWAVQPVLLAMLLDVPVSDHHVVLPDTDDPDSLADVRAAALEAIWKSDRRGYRTFEPLPQHIDQDQLFDLASQALKDVADADLMGDILESVAAGLQQADEDAGPRLRPIERGFHRDIDVVLFSRGRPRRLQDLASKLETDVYWARSQLGRGGDRADALGYLSERLSELANVLHQLRLYDDAADTFSEVIRIGMRIGGKQPAIAGYNRACALARGGRKDDAIRQLARALDRDLSSGSEDLTREWVTEDGDLETLHADPRYQALIRKRFGD